MAVYVDGFNFYHGLMAKGWGRYRWLDFRALLTRRVWEPQTLVSLKYFTSLVTHQPEKLVRQQEYLRALEAHSGITPVLGEYEQRQVQCRKCSAYYKRPQEKQTDVNVAIHLVADAHLDLYDTAYLVSADSDLIPAAAHIKAMGKRLTLIDPPRRHSTELAQLADRHWNFSRSHLAQSQLPNPVEIVGRKGKVKRIYCPPEWLPEGP